MDIQNLMELIHGAVEEGLAKVEFLAGVFSDHWNTGVFIGPAPTIAKRKANDQQAHVGYWREDCEQPKRATKGVIKDIPERRKKGAPAFVKLTPPALAFHLTPWISPPSSPASTTLSFSRAILSQTYWQA
jgi:hypothetical protein